MTAVSPSPKPTDPRTEFEKLQAVILKELVHSRPDEENYTLARAMCDLIEHIGRHNAFAAEVPQPIRDWLMVHGARTVYRRKIQILQRAAVNYEQREEQLVEGALLLGIEPNSTLNAPPVKPTTSRSYTLA